VVPNVVAGRRLVVFHAWFAGKDRDQRKTMKRQRHPGRGRRGRVVAAACLPAAFVLIIYRCLPGGMHDDTQHTGLFYAILTALLSSTDRESPDRGMGNIWGLRIHTCTILFIAWFIYIFIFKNNVLSVH
jgi:hypothetical protein